ncbi:MAG: hypothetical protein WC725_02165 [Patescibacteria group bacterium]
MIIGHEQILRFFENALKEGRLSHAYGFIGPAQVGKKALASVVAAKLLGTTVEKLSMQPDYIYLERGEDEKTGKLKKVITIEQSRDLKGRLQNSTWGGGKRVVIIDGAELFNDESGNALLKILEEPPQNTFFFLIIKNEANLLATIRSRLQLFYFSLVSTREIENGLRARGVKSEEAEIFSRRASGKPGKAINFLNEENKIAYENLFSIFQQLSGAPFYKKIKLVEELYGDKDDGERGREAWQGILDQWIGWSRDWLLKKHGATEYASEPGIFSPVSFTGTELVKIIDGWSRVKKLLKENAHPRLAIEEALLKIK